jgi:hypothetical protein
MTNCIRVFTTAMLNEHDESGYAPTVDVTPHGIAHSRQSPSREGAAANRGR